MSDHHPARRPVLLALSLGVLMAQVDTSVVNLAVQPIRTGLEAGPAALQWVVDAYNLTYALLLLTGGMLGDLYGRRRVFMAGVALFAAGCALCGLAPGIAILIAGRTIAGVGAALLLPCSLAIIRVVWTDPAERGHALGVWASCNGLAFAIGPGLGGLLIETLGWRSVFLIALPIGAATLWLAWRAVPESADPAGRKFDLAGQSFGAFLLGALSIAAIEGRDRPGVLAAALPFALVAAFLFIRAERRLGDAALVPLALFRERSFAGAATATTAMTFGMYGLLFLLPLTWQAGTQPVSALMTGLGLMPLAVIFVLVSRRSGAIAQRIGLRRAIVGGTGAIGGGLLVVAMTRAGRPLALAEAGLVLTGFGMGLATGPLLSVAVAAVPAARAGTASALINVARMVGATLGVALLGTLYAALGGGATGFSAALLAGGVTQLLGSAVAFWEVLPRSSYQR